MFVPDCSDLCLCGFLFLFNRTEDSNCKRRRPERNSDQDVDNHANSYVYGGQSGRNGKVIIMVALYCSDQNNKNDDVDY